MLLLLLAVAASTAQCPAERARYVLRGDPATTASFAPAPANNDWPSGLVLTIRSRRTGQSSWWLPWNGGSNNLQNLASTTNPRAKGWRPPNPDGGPRPFGDREYIGTDAGYTIVGDIPRRGGVAPAHMLVPQAGSSQDKIFTGKQFFDLVGC